MKVHLNSVDGRFAFNAKNEKGHEYFFSGNGEGVSPMEALLMSAAGCSSIDAELFLKKMRQPLEKIEVEVEGKRAEDPPKVFTDIHLKFTLYGDLDDKKVQKALDMSMNTYCSVSKMLEKAANISYEYRIKVPETT
ncbi:MAG: OsmC family peroxiredoxin [Saprospirales bacterium]|nr:MAG: OsmC family peroxiredoxin [Saprospirales bacterium]